MLLRYFLRPDYRRQQLEEGDKELYSRNFFLLLLGIHYSLLGT
jgi:hypothetical protein